MLETEEGRELMFHNGAILEVRSAKVARCIISTDKERSALTKTYGTERTSPLSSAVENNRADVVDVFLSTEEGKKSATQKISGEPSLFQRVMDYTRIQPEMLSLFIKHGCIPPDAAKLLDSVRNRKVILLHQATTALASSSITGTPTAQIDGSEADAKPSHAAQVQTVDKNAARETL